MNKWNRLLAFLDQVFGFPDKQKSSLKKVHQYFDERANEHVVLIEYRVMRTDGVVKRKARVAKRLASLDLLKDLTLRAEYGDGNPPPPPERTT